MPKKQLPVKARIRKDRPLKVKKQPKPKKIINKDARPNSLQRLRDMLRKHDWDKHPDDHTIQDKAMEERIRYLISKMPDQETEVRELWSKHVPAKLPTPFGLKPLPKPKEDKKNKGIPFDPRTAFQRRIELGLPDPNNEVGKYMTEVSDLIGKLADMACCAGLTVPKLIKRDKDKKCVEQDCGDKILSIKHKALNPHIIEAAEKDRKQYKLKQLESATAIDLLAEALERKELTKEQIEESYGYMGLWKTLSRVGARRDEAKFKAYQERQAALSSNGQPTDSAKPSTGAKKEKVMSTKTAKTTKTSKDKTADIDVSDATLRVSYQGPRGEHIREFESLAAARGFYKYKVKQGQKPEFLGKAKKVPAKEPTKAEKADKSNPKAAKKAGKGKKG